MMEEDVKLSMEHAHWHRVLRTSVLGVLAFVALVATAVTYNNHMEHVANVTKAQSAAAQAHDEALKAMWDHQKAP